MNQVYVSLSVCTYFSRRPINGHTENHEMLAPDVLKLGTHVFVWIHVFLRPDYQVTL